MPGSEVLTEQFLPPKDRNKNLPNERSPSSFPQCTELPQKGMIWGWSSFYFILYISWLKILLFPQQHYIVPHCLIFLYNTSALDQMSRQSLANWRHAFSTSVIIGICQGDRKIGKSLDKLCQKVIPCMLDLVLASTLRNTWRSYMSESTSFVSKSRPIVAWQHATPIVAMTALKRQKVNWNSAISLPKYLLFVRMYLLTCNL